MFIKKILLLLIIMKVTTTAYCQVADVVVYKGDTLKIFSDPLESWSNKSKSRIFFGQDTCSSAKCITGYMSEWLIDDDRLSLKNIFNCCYEKDTVLADLKKIFSKKFKKNLVFADWFTGSIIGNKGKVLFTDLETYESIYEKEIEFTITKGEVVKTTKFDNTKTKISSYYSNLASLSEFLNSSINWKKIPPLKNKIIFVDITFSADETGKVDKVFNKKKDFDQLYYDEAIRVIKKIPSWNVLYNHGKFERKEYTQTLEFSEEIRKKYAK